MERLLVWVIGTGFRVYSWDWGMGFGRSKIQHYHVPRDPNSPMCRSCLQTLGPNVGTTRAFGSLGFFAGNGGPHSSQDWYLRPFPNTPGLVPSNIRNAELFLGYIGIMEEKMETTLYSLGGQSQVVESLPSQDSAARGPDGNSHLHDRKQWFCMACWAMLAHEDTEFHTAEDFVPVHKDPQQANTQNMVAKFSKVPFRWSLLPLSTQQLYKTEPSRIETNYYNQKRRK